MSTQEMISQDKADELAREWIEAWNSHDLDAIMSHYSDDVELTSPNVVKLLGDESGTVRGRDALRAYFKKGLEAYPGLRFELIEVFTGVNSIVLYYARVNGPSGAELMAINAEGKIQKVIAHYDYSK